MAVCSVTETLKETEQPKESDVLVQCAVVLSNTLWGWTKDIPAE